MGVFVPVIDIPGNAGSATKLAADAGTLPSAGCRAWVNFDGTAATSPIAPRGSFNVSSVTRDAVGLFTVNFTNPMPDTNYAIVGTSSYDDGTGTSVGCNESETRARTVSAVAIRTQQGNNGTNVNRTRISVGVFR